jgi:hypothetical protein
MLVDSESGSHQAQSLLTNPGGCLSHKKGGSGIASEAATSA